MKTATNTAKSLAQQIARQIAQEPLEILKTAKEQVAPTEKSEQPRLTTGQESGQNTHTEQQKQADNLRIQRRMEALNRELMDIEKQNLFKDLQKRISEGEEIPLEDYPELSLEQKQVLKAQMEAVQNQIEKTKESGEAGLLPMSSRPTRRFGAGQKQQAQKEQTRVEKPVPPSG